MVRRLRSDRRLLRIIYLLSDEGKKVIHVDFMINFLKEFQNSSKINLSMQDGDISNTLSYLREFRGIIYDEDGILVRLTKQGIEWALNNPLSKDTEGELEKYISQL
jgi:hypothetical protein